MICGAKRFYCKFVSMVSLNHHIRSCSYWRRPMYPSINTYLNAAQIDSRSLVVCVDIFSVTDSCLRLRKAASGIYCSVKWSF